MHTGEVADALDMAIGSVATNREQVAERAGPAVGQHREPCDGSGVEIGKPLGHDWIEFDRQRSAIGRGGWREHKWHEQAAREKAGGHGRRFLPWPPAYLTSTLDVGKPAAGRLRYFVSTGTFRDVADGDFVSSTVSTPLS